MPVVTFAQRPAANPMTAASLRPQAMDAESMSMPTSERLIAHVGWIRELARHMVADANAADDLVQEACVVALEQEPRDALRWKGWLTSVMRNLVRQNGRSESRRRAREEFVARDEGLEATDRLVERVAIHRAIVGAVLDLDEPYRTTVLLRFFEDLPPREIARELGVPVATVQSRLTRALSRLRERLDHAHGDDRRAWLALLLPFAIKPKGPLVLTLGGVIVNVKLLLVAVSIVLVATVVAVVELGGSASAPLSPEHRLALDERKPAELASPPHDALEVAHENGGRAEITAPAADSKNEQAGTTTPGTLRRVRGRVLDADGAPVAGLAITFDGGETQKLETRSGAGGWFEFETPAAEGTLSTNAKAFANVRNGVHRASSSVEPIVIVAPAIDAAGTVLDPQHAPVQSARVALALPKGFETRFGQVLESTRVLEWSARTDASGHFAFAGIPEIAGATLRVLVDGYKPSVQAEPEFSDPNLAFVLERPDVLAQGALHGRVVDKDGRPVGEARVATGLTSTTTDAKGEFALDLAHAATAASVTAVKQGFRPASMERPSAPAGDDTGWPDFIELRLGGPPLSIVGHVVGVDGKPRADVRVWIADPTPFGLIGRMPAQIENLMAGAVVPPQALEHDGPERQQDGDDVIDNRMAGGPPTAFWNWVVSDESGRFELDGLDDRAYALRVLDTKTLQKFTSEPVRAGEHAARVEMPAPALYPKLAGRVVTLGERPVGGVHVGMRTTSFEAHTRFFGGKLNLSAVNFGENTITDAEGRFEFENVPRTDVYFMLNSDRIVPHDYKLEGGDDPEHLTVHVDVRCQVEVRLKAPVDRADEIAVLDDHGEGIDLIRVDQGRIDMVSEAPLVDGHSGVVSVSSSARTLVLRKNKVVVETRPISLVPDQVNLIEL